MTAQSSSINASPYLSHDKKSLTSQRLTVKAGPKDQELLKACRLLTKVAHGQAKKSGWWTDLQTGEDLTGMPPKRNAAELLALVHSEISEALEGFRKNQPDDHLPWRSMAEVELADAVIRIFDMAGGLKLDVAGALVEKMKYNAQRQDHRLEERKKTDGKKF